MRGKKQSQKRKKIIASLDPLEGFEKIWELSFAKTFFYNFDFVRLKIS
jgi:hypothetical protein